MEIKAEIRAIAQNKKSEDEDGDDSSSPIRWAKKISPKSSLPGRAYR
jgi:hypothetical protein